MPYQINRSTSYPNSLIETISMYFNGTSYYIVGGLMILFGIVLFMVLRWLGSQSPIRGSSHSSLLAGIIWLGIPTLALILVPTGITNNILEFIYAVFSKFLFQASLIAGGLYTVGTLMAVFGIVLFLILQRLWFAVFLSGSSQVPRNRTTRPAIGIVIGMGMMVLGAVEFLEGYFIFFNPFDDNNSILFHTFMPGTAISLLGAIIFLSFVQ